MEVSSAIEKITTNITAEGWKEKDCFGLAPIKGQGRRGKKEVN